MDIKALTESFSPTINFWEVNPQLKGVGIFKDLIESDKSKKKENSSKLMWFTAYCYDMRSPLYNLVEGDRVQIICEDIVEDANFYKDNKAKINELKEVYMKLQDTPAMRQLRVWNKKMEEKTLFMESTPYAEDTWEMLDKMQSSNVAAYKNYQQILEMISKEDAGSSSRGGQEPTLSDAGII
jgi:hypothetical protein